MSVNYSNTTLVFFKVACQANPGAEKIFTGSSSKITLQIFLKFSKTSANSNVSLLR